jgi:uncharacterized membrane protein
MFCDGVFAIAITLLVLDIKVPELYTVHSVADVWYAVGRLWPSFFAFVLSFTIIFISWIGHNNLLSLIEKTSSQFQVANGYFLLTIILLPFSTAFMAEYLDTPFAQPAIVFFCLNSLLHKTGWIFLHRSILKPVFLLRDSKSAELHKQARKGAGYGFFIYATLALLSWWLPYIALTLAVLTWIYWLYLSLAVRDRKQK